MRTGLLVQYLLAGLFLLLVPLWRPAVIDYSTLDGSWQAVFAHLAFQDIQFGRDLVYTVGPYGWLREGVYWPGLHGPLIAWGILVATVLAVLCRMLLRDLEQRWIFRSALLLALVPMIAVGRVITMLYLIDCLVLFGSLFITRNGAKPVVALCGAFLSLSSLVFFPQMIAATGTVLIFSLVYFARFQKISILPPVFAGTLIAWWILAKQPLAAIPGYISTSIDITRGYADVMSREGRLWEIGALLVMFVIVLALVVVSRHGESPLETALLAIGLVMLFFLSFKHATVRHQTHRLAMPAIAAYGAAVAQFTWLAKSTLATRRRWLVAASGTVAMTLLVNLFLMTQPRENQPSKIENAVRLPVRQASSLVQFVRQPYALGAEDQRNRAQIRSRFPLPRIDGSVDLFGDRQGIVLCHGLDYRPRPVFQRYLAFTPGLAKMNGEFLADKAAPHRIIIDLTGFGGILRPQLDPTSFIEILQSYENVESHEKLAIVKRAKRRPFHRQPAFEITTSPGQWVSTAEHCDAGPIWIKIDASRTLRGTIADVLFKTPPLALDLQFRDGSSRTFRFAAIVAEAGFWLSPTIQNSRQFVDYMNEGFDEIGADRIVSGLQIRESSGKASWAWRDFRIRVFRLVRSENAFGPQLVAQ